MLHQTFVLIYRNALRFKTTFIINLAGLTTGFTCCLLIYLWITDEVSFDKYHQNDSRLFQAMYHETTANEIKTTGQTPYFLSDALKSDFAEVEKACVATPPDFFPDFTVRANDKEVKAVGKFVEPDFFRMFSYTIVAGNAVDPLSDPASVSVSESLARKLYNSTDVIGKPLDYALLHLKKQVFISSVFKDVPANSTETFDFVLSFDIIDDLMSVKGKEFLWENTDPFFTYVLLGEGVDIQEFNIKLTSYIRNKSKESSFSLFLRPFSEKRLFDRYENGKVSGGRINNVLIFSAIALFVVLMACINFINLRTAQARTRFKEIGIKKMIGATKKSLLTEYVFESVLVSEIAIIFACIIAYFLLPYFNTIVQKDLYLPFSVNFVFGLVIMASTVGVIAGIYPALYISGLDGATITNRFVPTSLRELLVRKGLVIFQFALSTIFITSVIVVYNQLEFLQSKELGYKKNNLLYFNVGGNTKGSLSGLLNEIKEIPGVLNASSMMGSLTGQGNGRPGFIEYDGKKITMHGVAVNYDLLETIGIEMKKGRSFSRTLDHDADTMKWILNEAAAEAIGKDDLVGEIISDREVIGIAKNFHFQSLHEEVKPFAIRLEPHYAMDIWVRIESGREEECIRALGALYSRLNPGATFDYKLVADAYKAQYQSEQTIAAVAKYFAILAITISCLGVFGLAAFTTERRKREIGIRKILGATERGIVLNLSQDFINLVLIAIVIAVPISYGITSRWLQTFAYNIDLSWWHFTVAGVLALMTALITVCSLTVKASASNPVDALRSN